MTNTTQMTSEAGSIIFKFGAKAQCVLETQNPEFAYWITAWISERIDYETLIRILWFGNEGIAQKFMDFVKICTGSGI